MNVKEAIMGRRSVRKYKKTPISEEDIREILEAGFDEALREQFAPDKGKMMALLTFGYPDQEPRMPKRREGRYEIIS